MAAAPAAEGSVKWQLCYDMRAKTWWMVSGGGGDGESWSGLGHLILEGGGQLLGRSGTLGQGHGGYAATLAGAKVEEGWDAIRSPMLVWSGGFPELGVWLSVSSC